MRAWVVGLIIWIAASPAMGQAIPRTADGHPDFHGTWSGNFISGAFERLPGASGLVVSEEEAKRLSDAWWEKRLSGVYDPNENLGLARSLPRVNGELRSAQITDPPDGKLPTTKIAADLLQARRARLDARPAGPEDRGMLERCIGGLAGAPLTITPTDNLRQIVQTPDHVVIFNETDVGEARIIGIGAKPRPASTVHDLGDSFARWEGDTLVVETINRRVETRSATRGSGIIVTSQARVIERFSYISNDEMLYRYTVEDSVMYARPWSAEYSMRRTNARVYETACHEGNYSMTNMLAAARASERRK
jgi:hypothetical protein